MQFIINAYDYTDKDALERRMAVRPRHLENIKKVMENDRVICAGGLTDENEVMFTLRGDRLQLLTEGIQLIAKTGFGYQGLKMEMDMNFPRPPFYNAMFEKWGLETGPEWKK